MIGTAAMMSASASLLSIWSTPTFSQDNPCHSCDGSSKPDCEYASVHFLTPLPVALTLCATPLHHPRWWGGQGRKQLGAPLPTRLAESVAL
jgi:hypothetical protein